MRRDKLKQNPGKYVLAINRFGRTLYLHESGTANAGTPDEQKYVNWTRFINEAQGFETSKTARAMARNLAEYGEVVLFRRRGQ